MSQKVHNVIEQLLPFLVPIDGLNLDPQNARTHSEFNVKAVKDSLTQAGQRFPIIVQKSGMIVRAGNARLTAAQELGWTHIAAIVIDEPDEDAIKFAIRDNKTGLLGDWDYPILSTYLKDYAMEGFDLEQLGFQQHELDVLLQADFTPKMPDDTNQDGVKKELTVRVTGDAVLTVMRALEKCKTNLEGGADVTQGRLVELICAEYLS